MLLSFPHMGKICLSLTAACRLLDIPYIVPPPPGPKALQLGQELAPEGSCLPFCLVLGNMRQALDLGADTIIMLGGAGPCRFGYFVYLAVRILNDAGYNFQPIIIDNGFHLKNYTLLKKEVRGLWLKLVKAVRFGWEMIACEETIARLEREYLPRVTEPCGLQSFLDSCRQCLNQASSLQEIRLIKRIALNHLKQISLYPDSEVLRIGLVGDIYTLLEPYANQGIEEFLRKKGVAVYKEMSVSYWIPNTILPWRRNRYYRDLVGEASPYLRYCVGGFALESVANTLKMKRQSVDGVIQLFPLGCMPEIVAHSALNKICCDENVPVLSVTLDQHDSDTGFETRLEAFLDMIANGKKGVATC